MLKLCGLKGAEFTWFIRLMRLLVSMVPACVGLMIKLSVRVWGTELLGSVGLLM